MLEEACMCKLVRGCSLSDFETCVHTFTKFYVQNIPSF